MRFADIKDNEEVIKALRGMVDSDRVPHAIIFSEDDGGGAMAVCLAFLQYLYCRKRSGGDSCAECPSCNKISKLIHPDIYFIYPTGAGQLSEQYLVKFRSVVRANPYFSEAELDSALEIDAKNSLIPVSESKRLLEILSLSALEGGYRSVVVYLPERMNAEAANRLLKIIEEPPLKTQFLLITHQSEKLLPTITSRCQHIRIRSHRAEGGSAEVFDQPELLGGLFDALCERDLLSALEFSEKLSALPRESAKSFCKYAGSVVRAIFLSQLGLDYTEPAFPRDRVAYWASRLGHNFPEGGLAALNKAREMIERNVNAKILFTDLVDKLYILI